MASDETSGSDRLRLIKVLTTGGTIATGLDPSSGETAPLFGGDAVTRLAGQAGPVDAEEISRVPSWQLTPDQMRVIALRIRDEARTHPERGLVVTVGTSALEYLAYMTELFFDADAAIVFTGAMHRADDPSPDGPSNLRDALDVARADESRGKGVLVAFHGRILSARGVWKRHRHDIDAFIDVNGPVGKVVQGDVTYERTPVEGPRFSGVIDPAVALLKVVPGADASAVDAALDRGTHGLVVEGLPGAGAVPLPMLEGVARAVAANVPVVIASRAPQGRVPTPPTGGTGSPLRALPLLSANDLTAEKAWILLMVALGEGRDPADASRLFNMVAQAAG
ncbi:MAG: asparaginase [Candidatus Dormiibacterota bacterium]